MLRLLSYSTLAGLLACAPAIPPCGPSTCAGGCCDERGVCVAGRTKRSCGLGGVACTSCEGLQQCVAGACAEPPADAGVDAGQDDAGAVTPDAGRLRTVSVRRTDEVWTPDGGVIVTEIDLNNEPGQRLLYENAGGEWVSVAPEPGSGPILRFAGVPEGPYVVARPNDLLVSNADEFDTGVRVVGRRSEPLGAPSTSLTLDVSGVAPVWRPSDVVAATSFGSGLLAENFRVSMSDGGAFVATADMQAQGAPYGLSSALGDDLLVTMRRPVTDAGLSWSSTTLAAVVAAPDLGNGQASRAPVRLSPVAQTAFDVDLRSSGFEQFVTDVNPSATVVSTHALAFAAAPAPRPATGGDFESRSMTLSFVSNAPGRGDLRATITVGNPVPGASVLAEGRLLVTVPLSLSGRVLNRALDAIGTVRADGGVLDATLSPPRFLRINGERAEVNRTGVGTSPVIEWAAPSLGTPRGYIVIVNRLTPQGTTLVESFALRLRTPFTRVRVPPGLLQEGAAYFAFVIALSGDGVDARLLGAHTTREGARATAATAVFTP